MCYRSRLMHSTGLALMSTLWKHPLACPALSHVPDMPYAVLDFGKNHSIFGARTGKILAKTTSCLKCELGSAHCNFTSTSNGSAQFCCCIKHTLRSASTAAAALAAPARAEMRAAPAAPLPLAASPPPLQHRTPCESEGILQEAALGKTCSLGNTQVRKPASGSSKRTENACLGS